MSYGGGSVSVVTFVLDDTFHPSRSLRRGGTYRVTSGVDASITETITIPESPHIGELSFGLVLADERTDPQLDPGSFTTELGRRRISVRPLHDGPDAVGRYWNPAGEVTTFSIGSSPVDVRGVEPGGVFYFFESRDAHSPFAVWWSHRSESTVDLSRCDWVRAESKSVLVEFAVSARTTGFGDREPAYVHLALADDPALGCIVPARWDGKRGAAHHFHAHVPPGEFLVVSGSGSERRVLGRLDPAGDASFFVFERE